MDNQIIVKEPDNVTQDVLLNAKVKADEIISMVLESPQDVSLFGQINSLGKSAVDTNTKSISLIEDKVDGNTFNSDGLNSTLVEIKSELDLINPSVVGQTEQDFKSKILWIIPWTVKRLPKSTEIMSIINGRKDSTKDVIDGLQAHLWSERDKANNNAAELSVINERLYEGQRGLSVAIYQGSYIWEQLSKEITETTDDVRRNALQRIINDVATTVVDLQTVEVLNAQTRMGAENLIHNSNGINKLVYRINNVLLPSVANMLAVKAAAQQQKNIVDMGNAIMASASRTISDTAKEVNQTIVETAKANSGSLVQLESIQESCDSFEEARLELLTIMQDTESKARKISNELSAINCKQLMSLSTPTKKAITNEN